LINKNLKKGKLTFFFKRSGKDLEAFFTPQKEATKE